MVGYGQVTGQKGYRLWDPEMNKIIISRDVKFDEKNYIFIKINAEE